MSIVSLNVNGAVHEVDVDTSTPLLYVLRNDLGLRGPRFGCGLGQCGACTVIIDGAAVRSCQLPVAAVSVPGVLKSTSMVIVCQVASKYRPLPSV